MVIKTLTLGFTKTVNIGNYENVKVDVGATIETSTETFLDDQELLSDLLRTTLDTEVENVTPERPTRKAVNRKSVHDED
jgi:hypothetical protein